MCVIFIINLVEFLWMSTESFSSAEISQRKLQEIMKFLKIPKVSQKILTEDPNVLEIPESRRCTRADVTIT